MNLRIVSLLAAAGLALPAAAQTYVYNGDIAFSGTLSERTVTHVAAPVAVSGFLDVGFLHNWGSDDYGVQFHLASPGALAGANFIAYGPDSGATSWTTDWSSGNTVFSFSLAASGTTIYEGVFGDGKADPVVGAGNFSLQFTTQNQYAATNPGEWSLLPGQLEYAASGFGMNPFLSLDGTLTGSFSAYNGLFDINLALSYAPGAGQYSPLYSTPVPEPSTYGLAAAAALLALALRRRFRRR